MSDNKNDFISHVAKNIALEHMHDELMAGRALYIDLQDIKQNGLELDSPLLWALFPDWVNWVAIDKNKNLWGYSEKPFLSGVNLEKWHKGLRSRMYNIFIKINYTKHWRLSLTKRPDGM